MQEVTFDPLIAIQNAVASQSEQEREEFAKFQEERRQELFKYERSQREVDKKLFHGLRAIEYAEMQLQNGDSDSEYDRMAEGYSLIGDYEKAAQIARNESKKAEYALIRDSFDKPPCDCPKAQKVGKDTISTEFVKDRFYSGKRIRELIECVTCHQIRC